MESWIAPIIKKHSADDKTFTEGWMTSGIMVKALKNPSSYLYPALDIYISGYNHAEFDLSKLNKRIVIIPKNHFKYSHHPNKMPYVGFFNSKVNLIIIRYIPNKFTV